MYDFVRRTLARTVAAGVLLVVTGGLVHAQSSPVAPTATTTETGPEALYRSAREAMVRGDLPTSIRLFGQVASQYPNSKFASTSLYYRAFLQYRQYTQGEVAPLRSALASLKTLERRYPDAPQVNDARTLRTRVCGELAQQFGDEACREEIVAAAQQGMPRPSTTARRATIGPNGGAPANPQRATMFGGTATITMTPEADCRNDQSVDKVVAVLNSLWKVDSSRAIENTSRILAERTHCFSRARQQAILMILQRPAPVMRLAPSLFDTAKNDPDPGVRNLAMLWLLSQEWDPNVAKFLNATFGQTFRTKSQ